MQDLYSQDNQDCDSSTFQLRVQDNQDFSGTLLQDLCGTQNCTGTFSQDSSGHDTCEFNSKLEETNRVQGATCGLVETSSVAGFTLSSVPFPDTGDLRVQGCNANSTDSSVLFTCAESAFSLDMVALHERVFASGLPNYKGLRIPLASKLNVAQWRSSLKDYHDNIIVDYLKFGWPVGYNYEKYGFLVSQLRNHSGAIDYPDELDTYLVAERARLSIARPFLSPPFSGRIAISPLNSVPKKDSTERRIILDLSWPLNTLVNTGIDKSLHEGMEFALQYPTVDHIASLSARKGPGCLIYKCDLRKAYRQFYVDPFDFPLTGFHWNNCYYFDAVLPMGLRLVAMACQRITSAISYICLQRGFDVLNYLDDFQGAEVPAQATAAFRFLQSLLVDLGVDESKNKACPPSMRTTCLGVEFDTLAMTKSVHADCLAEIQEFLRCWSHKAKATKRDLQSLLGKLSFVSKCVKNSRIFLMRIIDLLKGLKHHHHRVSLNKEFKKDIRWWLNFITVYNGVSIILDTPWSAPDCVFVTDACLTGCGEICGDRIFHTSFPDSICQKFSAIHQLEFIALLVAIRLWGSRWAGLRIQVFCNNEAVVAVINSGKTSDPHMGTILRNMWLSVSSRT